ncbi:hypothetical protein PHAVU_002G027300 [Phaseolus vulgaris]|uniref:Uncharacterized protein n=1 Tax=Phaseolus vulgaris TaxID=3885 RepID=V7CJ13_PHAVU|nr:hypothetical protein PHAVU_002G027300g [Phaseolus vulgaris]ESW28901.1 hypothetical protein PHAVU_002G027300g [Phaseolus vulgaris]
MAFHVGTHGTCLPHNWASRPNVTCPNNIVRSLSNKWKKQCLLLSTKVAVCCSFC